MAASAKAYDFADFDAPESSEAAAEELFTRAELGAACAQARDDAAKTIAAGEARNQTALLQSIADRLAETASGEVEGVADYAAMLTETAQALVEEFCIAASVAQQADAAKALIERCLKTPTDVAPVTLFLSSKTPAAARTLIEKAMAERAAGDLVGVEKDTALAPGELRLEWRGGEATRDHETLRVQIREIFAAAAPRAPHRKKKKEPTS